MLTSRVLAVQAVEIIPGRLYMAALKTADGLQRSGIASGSITYCIDNELVGLCNIDSLFYG